MHANLSAPTAGDGVSAAWARALVEELRRCRLSAAWPLVIRSRGPAGTVLAVAASAASGAASAPRTWSLSVESSVATCRYCMTMLSTVTVFKAGEDLADGDEMELTASLSGEKGWLCGTINGTTKELGLAFGDPPDALDARDMPRIPGYW